MVKYVLTMIKIIIIIINKTQNKCSDNGGITMADFKFGISDFWEFTQELDCRDTSKATVRYIFKDGRKEEPKNPNIQNITEVGVKSVLFTECRYSITYTLTYPDKYIELIIKK